MSWEKTCTILRHEYTKLISTVQTNGWMRDSWTPPSLSFTRARTHGHISGLWMPRRARILIRIGPYAPLGLVYECMAHELTHDCVVEPEGVDHGPDFRRFLRRLVRAHWPEVPDWIQFHNPGSVACYAEDDNIAAALQTLYTHVGPQPRREPCR